MKVFNNKKNTNNSYKPPTNKKRSGHNHELFYLSTQKYRINRKLFSKPVTSPLAIKIKEISKKLFSIIQKAAIFIK